MIEYAHIGFSASDLAFALDLLRPSPACTAPTSSSGSYS